VYNTTLNAISLDDYSSDGVYTSDIFDAGIVVGWKNMSWGEESLFGGELPDNKESNSRIDMGGNVLLMHLNDGDEATAFSDTSGESNTGSCTGATCPSWNNTGVYNGAFQFDGQNDYISIPKSDSLDLNNSFTISLWVKFADSRSCYIINNYEGSGAYNGNSILIHADPTEGKVEIGGHIDDNVNPTMWKGAILDINRWYHIALVRYKGDNASIFIDGAYDSNAPDITTGDILSDRDWVIGRKSQDPADEHFKGSIDEVAIYNRALTPEEIQKQYDETINKINLSTRSCNDPNCNGESWSESLDNSTLSELPVANNRYFQYKATLESSGGTDTPKLYNVTINYGAADSEKPSIILSSPIDNSGDDGNLTTFSYTVYDESEIEECELVLDGIVQDTDDSIEKGVTQEFNIDIAKVCCLSTILIAWYNS
jgi:hypothetical protein